MKALTIWQPFAELIVCGRKRVENRSWQPRAALIGERVAIHSGLAKHNPGTPLAYDGKPWPTDAPRGFIVGTAKLVQAVAPRRRHMMPPCPFEDIDSWRWFFTDPIRVEPIEMKGRQGVWNVPDWAEAELLGTIGE